MSQAQMLQQLRTGNVQAVIAALEAAEAAYEQWCMEQESMNIARELSSTPEMLEQIPW